MPICGLTSTGTVRALVLDFDGLLVDTETADAHAWLTEFERVGVPITMETYAHWWAAWAWRRQVPMIERLRARAPGIDACAVAVRRAARYRELCRDLPLRPGMARWLADASAAGLLIAVATNDATGRAVYHLERLGVTGHLAAIITAANGARPKPHPDLYTQAADEMNLTADTCVAVEDAPHGITAAHAAGYAGAIAVPNTVTAHLLSDHGRRPGVAICPCPATTPLHRALSNGLTRDSWPAPQTARDDGELDDPGDWPADEARRRTRPAA